MKKRVAVILSGCGHKDGSEITEAVSTLIAISEAGAQYQVFAPTLQIQATSGDKRDVRTEASRISRTPAADLATLKAADFDALAFPGGFGAALHLCSWAQQGSKCQVHTEVERVIREFHGQEKPIAAICIAPVLLARVLGHEGCTVTIGRDANTAAEIAKTGARHEACDVEDYVSDREHRIVTTPAYMYDEATPAQVFHGVSKAIQELVEMA